MPVVIARKQSLIVFSTERSCLISLPIYLCVTVPSSSLLCCSTVYLEGNAFMPVKLLIFTLQVVSRSAPDVRQGQDFSLLAAVTELPDVKANSWQVIISAGCSVCVCVWWKHIVKPSGFNSGAVTDSFQGTGSTNTFYKRSIRNSITGSCNPYLSIMWMEKAMIA